MASAETALIRRTNTNFDIQYVPLFISPVAPASLSVSTAGVQNGGITTVNNDLTFHVTGVTSGLSVEIYVDGNSTPIGTATASGDTVDVQTSGNCRKGLTPSRSSSRSIISPTTSGTRRSRPATSYSDPSQSTVQFTVDVPPTPNPSTWATVPYATGPMSIKMIATTAHDPDGVQYYFHCSTSGGHDSGWQASPIYEDTGLLPGIDVRLSGEDARPIARPRASGAIRMPRRRRRSLPRLS